MSTEFSDDVKTGFIAGTAIGLTAALAFDDLVAPKILYSQQDLAKRTLPTVQEFQLLEAAIHSEEHLARRQALDTNTSTAATSTSLNSREALASLDKEFRIKAIEIGTQTGITQEVAEAFAHKHGITQIDLSEKSRTIYSNFEPKEYDWTNKTGGKPVSNFLLTSESNFSAPRDSIRNNGLIASMQHFAPRYEAMLTLTQNYGLTTFDSLGKGGKELLLATTSVWHNERSTNLTTALGNKTLKYLSAAGVFGTIGALSGAIYNPLSKLISSGSKDRT